MNTIPLKDFVLVSKDDQTQTGSSGIIFVSSSNNYITGVVLAVGTGKVLPDGKVSPPDVKVGDKVMFNKSISAEVKADGADVFCIREEQIMCIVK